MKKLYKSVSTIAALTALVTLPLLYASDEDKDTDDAATTKTRPALPKATVQLATVVEQSLSPEILIPGTVVSRNDAKVAAEVTGRLLKVAEVGTRVEKGDVLAQLDDTPLRFQLDDNNASILRLEASFKYNQKQVERLKSLVARNNTAKTQLDQAISQRDMTAQDLSRAKVNRERTLYQLERTILRAPFPGQVVERYQQAGEFSSIGRQVVRLVDTVNVEISAQAPVKVAPQLIDNMEVSIVGKSQSIITNVRAIISVGDDRSRNFELRIKVPAGVWVVGSPVKISLATEQKRIVVAVPRDALILRQNSTYLYKIKDDETATRVNIKTGFAKGDFIEVIGDIASGDRVVIRGGERLREGQGIVEKNVEKNAVTGP